MKTVSLTTSALVLFTLACEPGSQPAAPVIEAMSFAGAEWSEPVNLGPMINTGFNEQGPNLSRDGLSLYFGSDRPGGSGGFDIWVAHRDCEDCPWQAPENVGSIINSSANETGPGLSPDGHLLFLTSTRPGGQGQSDLYLSHRLNPNDDFGWDAPAGLGPDVNTAAAEAGAEYLQNAEDGVGNLYFNRALQGGTADLFYAAINRDGETRGQAVRIDELDDPIATDQGATLRSDGREIFFFSTRGGGLGAADIWTSTRESIHDPWEDPKNVVALNSPANEQQPSLSADGRTLVFASGRPGGFGGTDIWIATRSVNGR
jgi:WD40 repeat protein